MRDYITCCTCTCSCLYLKKNILFSIICAEIKAQREFLQNLENEGKLQQYLEKEPNFMYSLLADGRLTDDQIGSIVGDLFGAGIDSVFYTFHFI